MKDDLKIFKNLDLIIISILMMVRVLMIPADGVWWDEFVSIELSKLNIREIINISSHDTNTPLYYILLHILAPLINNLEFLYRLFSTICMLVTAWFIYIVSMKFTLNRTVSKGAALVSLISPFSIYVGYTIRVHALSVLITTFTLLTTYYILSEQVKVKFKWIILYTLSIWIGINLHITYFIFFACLNLFFLNNICKDKKAFVKKFYLYILIPLIVIILTIYLQNILGFKAVIPNIQTLINIKNNTDIFTYVSPNLNYLEFIIHTYTSNTDPLYIILIPIILGGVLFSVKERTNKVNELLIIFLITSTIAYCIHNQAFYDPRYIYYLHPLLCILISTGLYQIKTQATLFLFHKLTFSEIKKTQLVLCTFIAILMIGLTNNYTYSKYIEDADCDDALLSKIDPNQKVLLLVSPPGFELELKRINHNQNIKISGIHTIEDPEFKGLSLSEHLRLSWLPTINLETAGRLSDYVKNQDIDYIFYANMFYANDRPNLIRNTLIKDLKLYAIDEFACGDYNTEHKTLYRFRR